MKEHIKLYKSGKLWVSSLIAVAALAGFAAVSQPAVHADTQPVAQMRVAATDNAAVTSAQTAVSSASAAVQKASDAVNQAATSQAAAQSTQNDLNNTVASQSSALASATAKQTQLNQQIPADSTAIDQAKSAINNLAQDQAALSSAKAVEAPAQNDVNSAASVQSQAQSAANTASQALQDAQNNLSNLEKSFGVVNTINATSDFITQMRNARGNTFTIGKDTQGLDWDALVKACAASLKLNQYQEDEAAKAIPVHMNANGTLSHDDVVYATQYTAQLINPLRAQIGTPLYKISQGSIKIAEDVADRYQNDQWNPWIQAHDNAGLTDVGNDWGTYVGESWAGDLSFANATYDDSTGVWTSHYDSLTRNDLQRGIYNALLDLLFNDCDQGCGHTTDILGTRYPADYANPTDSTYFIDAGSIYLGVDYTYTNTGKVTNWYGQKNLYEGGFHFNSEGDPDSSYVKTLGSGYVGVGLLDPNTKFNQPENREQIAIPSVNDHQAEINAAKQAVAEKSQTNQAAQAKLNDANSALDQAQAKLTQAQNELKEAQAKVDADQKAQANLSQLESQLRQEQADLANVNTQIVQLQKDLKISQEKQSAGQRVLDEANAALSTANATLEQAQENLKNAQAEYDRLTGQPTQPSIPTTGGTTTGWQKINGHWYYFNNGTAQTGWYKSGAGNWYYFEPETAQAATNWQKINGRWYYFDNSNAWALTSWQKINNRWYYFDPTNAWADTGWFQSGAGNWYYFDPTNAWADTGWQKINNHWYYFDNNNAWALRGWQKINNRWYYFDPVNAWADTGWFQSGAGNWYYFDPTNAWADTGWQKINNRWYYFDNNNAWAAKGWFQTMAGDWYYFDPTNTWADTGWQYINGQWYYFDANGKMETGSVQINGRTYSFDNNGHWLGN
ncbi:SEC10/PgrA surface exclusion domain-containing protein [Limosilactobacillus sp.]|uniref:SEC10/PgrA surface exclusion domain-containing protein n=2 Tax=Limosilactobacillus sp. TaxID=2773925 RepID=UPI0025B7C06F|nr:SEC10/PgrA surface exclusion domain-containing protein [Limosilactobacillus sp.]MCH3922742.1 SEC10/PgrA surface exclusion domain-containing protein [Limosilactobacillus sp.]